MSKLSVFTNKGIKSKVIEPAVVKTDVNLVAVAQAVRVYTDHLHTAVSKVKTRGEVKISTRKIYRQKGTGNARHGAKSAPIFVGGGIAHGPKGIKRAVNLSKNIKDIALRSAISLKASEKMLVLAENLSGFKKTSEAAKLIAKIKTALNVNVGFRVSIVLPVDASDLAFRNLTNTLVFKVNELNALKVFDSGLIIMDVEAIKYFDISTKKIETLQTKVKKVAAKKLAVKIVKTAKSPVKGGKK